MVTVANRATYAISGWLFVRLLGVVYLFAFWSVAQQVIGLVGHDGILPAADYMLAIRSAAEAQHVGWARFHLVPTLCWWSTSDVFLQGLATGGALLALLLVLGVVPPLLLPILWLLYLSLSIVGRDFLSYQWDALLLEAGLIAIPLVRFTLWDRAWPSTNPAWLARWLLWWLLFRLMFASGLVKLLSGDPTWQNLTALAMHYETQPLPTPIAWYAFHLPLWFQRASTVIVLATELIVPWLIFAPRRPRLFAAAALITLQGLIAVTGNYAFFNLLTASLCVLLLDDATLRRFIPTTIVRQTERASARWPSWALAIVVAALTLPVSILTLANQIGLALPGSSMVFPLARIMEPVRSVNPYGLFAVMTTTRPEIVVEGSMDGAVWLPYGFFDKVGDLRARPTWVAPFQPRVDWQMWFAALGQFDREEWFQRFCLRLLEGSPSVLRFVEANPFKGRPPKFVRATLYQYRFANVRDHIKAGQWWTRERLGPYSPVLSLESYGRSLSAR